MRRLLLQVLRRIGPTQDPRDRDTDHLGVSFLIRTQITPLPRVFDLSSGIVEREQPLILALERVNPQADNSARARFKNEVLNLLHTHYIRNGGINS